METATENPRVNLESPSNDVAAYVDAQEDDTPTLSSQTLQPLKEFLSEQNPKLSRGTTRPMKWLLWRRTGGSASSGMIVPLPKPLLPKFLPSSGTSVPLPSLALLAPPCTPTSRFEQYGDEFTFYDYNQPEDLPLSLKHTFPIVVADPPYLSKECSEKVTETIKFLLRPNKSYILLLTGEVQRDRSAQLLGLRPCGFRPQHSSKLGNEFDLFTSYDPVTRLDGWEE